MIRILNTFLPECIIYNTLRLGTMQTIFLPTMDDTHTWSTRCLPVSWRYKNGWWWSPPTAGLHDRRHGGAFCTREHIYTPLYRGFLFCSCSALLIEAHRQHLCIKKHMEFSPYRLLVHACVSMVQNYFVKLQKKKKTYRAFNGAEVGRCVTLPISLNWGLLYQGLTVT